MANPSMDRDVTTWLRQQLQEAHPDLLRERLATMGQELMGAEAQQFCGAGYGERSSERTNSRNGYREREGNPRVGSITLAIPKLRQGSYSPDWLLEPRRRAERALVSVIAQADLAGVSTRRVEGLVQSLGIAHPSKSQVSVMAKSLDGIVNVGTAIATGVNANGYREILGVEVFTAEDGAAWTSFLRGLVARGRSGVRLVISDDHLGLEQAIAAVLPGAGWQRCRTHFMRSLLTRVPKSAQTLVATLVRSIFAQPDQEAVWAQPRRMVDQLQERFPDAASLLDEAGSDVLAFATFPREHWRQRWSNHPQERLNKEVLGERTWSASSPTAARCFGWSAPCSPNSTTSGWWPRAATSAPSR